MRALEGIFAPVVTPFGRDGAPDREALGANVRAHLTGKLAGIVIAGSTGEAALLEEGEREALLAWAREIIPRERWLIAGVGAESTRLTVARCRSAAERGADAVLVVAPHYYGSAMTQEALETHYSRVADQSPLPVLLYNIPKYTHFVLAPELVRRLAAHQNVIGIKDSAGDPALLAAYLAVQSDEFTVLTGHASGLSSALESGARGGILAVSQFATQATLAVWTRANAGDAAGARAAQERLTPLGSEIVGRFGIAGVKAALDELGLHGGMPRPPLLPLDRAGRAIVRDLLLRAGVAKAA